MQHNYNDNNDDGNFQLWRHSGSNHNAFHYSYTYTLFRPLSFVNIHRLKSNARL